MLHANIHMLSTNIDDANKCDPKFQVLKNWFCINWNQDGSPSENEAVVKFY